MLLLIILIFQYNLKLTKHSYYYCHILIILNNKEYFPNFKVSVTFYHFFAGFYYFKNVIHAYFNFAGNTLPLPAYTLSYQQTRASISSSSYQFLMSELYLKQFS